MPILVKLFLFLYPEASKLNLLEKSNLRKNIFNPIFMKIFK